MKRPVIFGIQIIAMGLNLFLNVHAQGTLVLSNLGSPSINTATVASDAWLAIGFHTEDLTGNSWHLDSVQLLSSGSQRSPEGFSVALYNFGRSAGPNELIGTLTGSDPLSPGVSTYTPFKTITLKDSRNYWLVVTSGTPVSGGIFTLYSTGFSDYDYYFISDGWSMGGNYLSSDGLNWVQGSGDSLQFAIYVSPVPELLISSESSETEISWRGLEGNTYQVQTRSSLTNGTWSNLGDPLAGNGSDLVITTPVTSEENYFRVEVLPEQ